VTAGRILPTLAKRGDPLASPEQQLEVLHGVRLPRTFGAALASASLFPLRPTALEVLQLNLGKRCNQTCRHCHVDAGPDRVEIMPHEVVERCLAVVEGTDIPTVDITGGAPELHPAFREIVRRARAAGKHVMDRCNLTVLLLPNYADLVGFLAEHRVEVVCSLPHYRRRQTDTQRGEGVFEESIEALRRLNAAGYGHPDSGLILDLVMNPVGAFLPGNQAALERDWKAQLARSHGIRFNRLFTITNMPLARYLEWLQESGNLAAYLERLVQAFNPAAAAAVMCRTTLSVGWDGRLHDCDFNQMLELGTAEGAPQTIFDFDLPALQRRAIRVGPHCFGCTAGAGSSCGGATA
jgi:radical SAM/Cys-rich protein